jgi:aspartyl-tRNA(Asn)/glutamyl-tRNA(Gln) amidotransferase subunit C
MKISKEEVQHVAALARLDMSEADIERMTAQLDTILTYAAKLDELDTTGIRPTTHTQEVCNAFREDVVRPSLDREAALANAPQANDSAFIVPRIIS